MFGKTVGKPCSPDILRKMYTTFLEATMIKSKKKLHLARRTMPTVLEEMGYVHASRKRLPHSTPTSFQRDNGRDRWHRPLGEQHASRGVRGQDSQVGKWGARVEEMTSTSEHPPPGCRRPCGLLCWRGLPCSMGQNSSTK